jgi:hypothetical protein
MTENEPTNPDAARVPADPGQSPDVPLSVPPPAPPRAPLPAPPPAQSSIAALLQLWTLRSSRPIQFPHAALIVVCMSALWLALWAAIDWFDALPDPQFLLDGVPLLAWYALAILALAALLRWRSSPMPPFATTLVLAAGLVPIPLCLAAIAAGYLNPNWLIPLAFAACVYVFLYLDRGLHSITGERQRAAGAAGLLFVAGFVWLTDTLDVIPDLWSPAEIQAADDGSANQADAETLLFQQSERIERALAAMTPAASSGPQAFFLGFAGVGEQKVFAQEIGLASRVLSERYGMNGRALSLVNDERDLERAPLATVSGLKYALRGIAARMNVDRDVLFLSISSHGGPDPAIAVSNSQLPLNELSDEDLAEALSDSGIKWRVIVISACYAGGFIESLKNPQTIVITAAAADRTSFGCSNDSDLTYFGEAFYRDALPDARSLRAAFEQAKSAIAARERREHVDASKPQAYFGAALEAKLAAMGTAAP